uniref:C2H2-type domain-containing protein n=1 Tax=Parastrongyloides trichosuri TaxID=131310 RepID=A0A0N4Z2E4_PARTI
MIHISSTPFICQFESCNLVWRNQKELLWHQQTAHIPEIRKKFDEEMKKAETIDQRTIIYSRTKLKTLLCNPLNFHFDTPPTPIEYKKYTLNFNLYTKNVIIQGENQNQNNPSQNRTSSTNAQVQKFMQLAMQAGQDNGESTETEGKYNGIDPSWLKPVEDRKFKCPFEGCNKKYKNMPGYRQHVRTAHGEPMGNKPLNTPLADDSSMDSSYFEETMGQSGSMELKKGPEIIKDKVYKCKECTKTYKTAQGLHTHLQSNHVNKPTQKFNEQYVQSRIAMDPMAREDSPAKISTFAGPTTPKQPKIIQRPQVNNGYTGQMTISNPSPKSLYVAKPSAISPTTRNDMTKPISQLSSVLLNSPTNVVPSPVPPRPSTMGMNIVNKNPIYHPISNQQSHVNPGTVVVSPNQKNQSHLPIISTPQTSHQSQQNMSPLTKVDIKK